MLKDTIFDLKIKGNDLGDVETFRPGEEYYKIGRMLWIGKRKKYIVNGILF